MAAAPPVTGLASCLDERAALRADPTQRTPTLAMRLIRGYDQLEKLAVSSTPGRSPGK
jgi:hypothetical protein